MKSIVLLFVGIFISANCLLARDSTQKKDMIEFTPWILTVKNGDHIYKKAPHVMTPLFFVALQKVLASYGETFTIEDGKILIRKELSDDHELLANYTSKALDILSQNEKDSSNHSRGGANVN